MRFDLESWCNLASAANLADQHNQTIKQPKTIPNRCDQFHAKRLSSTVRIYSFFFSCFSFRFSFALSCAFFCCSLCLYLYFPYHPYLLLRD